MGCGASYLVLTWSFAVRCTHEAILSGHGLTRTNPSVRLIGLDAGRKTSQILKAAKAFNLPATRGLQAAKHRSFIVDDGSGVASRVVCKIFDGV